jgi:hypothetical protein
MRNAGNIPEVVLSARPPQARALLARPVRAGNGAFPQAYDLPAICA